jgi:MerR family transcriptional regulator, light-induced transcriptional regulator
VSHSFSPRKLAGALGVSESSLKRWIDAGRIRATRTGGGHRRIAIADALAFIRETGAPVARPELLGMRDAPAPQVRGTLDDDGGLARGLQEGDAHAVRSWLEARLLAGARIAELCDGPIRTAMHSIGELWQHDKDGVFVEHRATDVCIQALGKLRSTFEPPPHAPIAIGGAPEDDPYLLPSAMAALVLAAEGLRTINLGADTPTGALHQAVAYHHPRLVWISASSPVPLPQAHELAEFLTTLPAGTVAVVGGRHRAAIAAAAPSARNADTMAELAELGRALL